MLGERGLFPQPAKESIRREDPRHRQARPGPETSIKVKPDGIGIVTDNVKWVINPFDEIAHRGGAAHQGEARRRRGGAGQRSAQKVAQEQLRTGLAMGADRAILVLTDDELDRSPSRACSRSSSRPRSPTWSCMGKQAIDDDANQAGQMLAAMLGWPQATFASKVESRGRQEVGDGARARSTAASRRSSFPLPGDHHHRPPPERAALRVAARHHEGAQEGAEGDPARGSRRRRRAHASRREARAAAEARRRARKVESVRSWSNLLHTEAKVI